MVRKQFELKEKAKAELVAKRQQEEEKAKALAIASSSTVAAPKLTPLISPSITAAAHRLPTRPIAAVSNLLAIQRAKEKIEEMKAAKLRQQNYTAATTVAKGVSRVAHVSKAVETTVGVHYTLISESAFGLILLVSFAAIATSATDSGTNGHQNLSQHSIAVL